jgi:hypothetical protein
MRRWIWAGVIGALALGCGSVKVAQRDGCWVRHSEGFLQKETEEVGICTRAEPKWSDDRVTRLVQECMAEADYRWRNQALSAWNEGKALPPAQSEHEVMQKCMNDAATSLIRENEGLNQRVAELTKERNALAARTDADHRDLRASQSEMTTALGEAAKRPAPNAYALSTSSGTASTQSDQTPAAPQQVVVPMMAPGGVPAQGQAREITLPSQAPGQPETRIVFPGAPSQAGAIQNQAPAQGEQGTPPIPIQQREGIGGSGEAGASDIHPAPPIRPAETVGAPESSLTNSTSSRPDPSAGNRAGRKQRGAPKSCPAPSALHAQKTTGSGNDASCAPGTPLEAAFARVQQAPPETPAPTPPETEAR